MYLLESHIEANTIFGRRRTRVALGVIKVAFARGKPRKVEHAPTLLEGQHDASQEVGESRNHHAS